MFRQAAGRLPSLLGQDREEADFGLRFALADAIRLPAGSRFFPASAAWFILWNVLGFVGSFSGRLYLS
jgi:hypothetical protein